MNYDHIISLGENCQTAINLRSMALRKEAFPFDWHGVRSFKIAGEGGFVKKIDLICNGFADFFNENNYEEFFESWETAHRLVLNKKTGLQFLHEFPKDKTIHEHFSEFVTKYRRRVDRLYDILKSNNSILFVFIEFFAHLTDEEINNAYQKLLREFPKSSISFLVVKNNGKLGREESIRRKTLPNVYICEINNDFSQDHLRGKGNIGNSELYRKLIWEYGTSLPFPDTKAHS